MFPRAFLGGVLKGYFRLHYSTNCGCYRVSHVRVSHVSLAHSRFAINTSRMKTLLAVYIITIYTLKYILRDSSF